VKPLHTLIGLAIIAGLSRSPGAAQVPHPAPDGAQNGVVLTNRAHNVIERAYLDVLHRYPDQSGLKTFTSYLLEHGKDEAWIRSALRRSPEGRKIAGRRLQKTALIAPGLLLLLILSVVFCRRENRKGLIFRVVLLISCVVMACLLLEIALRVKGRYDEKRNADALRNLGTTRTPRVNAAVSLRHIIQLSSNPKIVYGLIPYLCVKFVGARLTTDAHGFRITPGSTEDPGAFCIVGLGDSVMFGWGANDGDTYLAHLCRQIKEKRPDVPVRILNMAVPGYNTVMEVERLKAEALWCNPDLVIIHFVGNDLRLPNFIREDDRTFTLTKSYLLSSLSRLTGGRLRTQPFPRLVRTSRKVPDKYRHMVGERAYRDAMKELRALSDQHGFKIVLVCNWEAPPLVRDVTSQLGIPVIELGPPINEYCQTHGISEYQGSVLTVSKRDPHYSAVAHKLVAEVIFARLTEHHMLNPFTTPSLHPGAMPDRKGPAGQAFPDRRGS